MYRIQFGTFHVTFLTMLALLLAGCSQASSHDASPTPYVPLHGNASAQSIEIDH